MVNKVCKSTNAASAQHAEAAARHRLYTAHDPQSALRDDDARTVCTAQI